MTPDGAAHTSVNEVAHLRHELRTPVNQIVGYCEMLLEDAEDADFAHRRQSISEALQASRQVTSLIDAGLPAGVTVLNPEAVRVLYDAIRDPQTRILAAMSALLLNGIAADSAEYIGDVRRIREAAERLIPTDRRRAEPTATFEAANAVFTADYPIPTTPRAYGVARILVVDDMETNRFLLEIFLRRNGFEPTLASGGEEAVQGQGQRPSRPRTQEGEGLCRPVVTDPAARLLGLRLPHHAWLLLRLPADPRRHPFLLAHVWNDRRQADVAAARGQGGTALQLRLGDLLHT
jgi:CheY-like chemotaxis protein